MEPQQSVNPLAVETEHSSRAIALQLQRETEELGKPVVVLLNEQDKTMAATEASARRHELLQVAQQAARERKWGNDEEENGAAYGDALVRASERKVRKQLDSKWLQARQDPANRPRGPLERPEEKDLRETLFRLTASDVLRSGVLFDEADVARMSEFGPMSSSQLRVMSSGIVGMPGCCFEKY